MNSIVQIARKLVRAPLHAITNAMPLSVWKRLFPKDVITLCYHVVSDEELPHIKFYRYKNVKQFESDLTYLKARHHFLSYDEVVCQRVKNASLPPNGFFLTFDDGLAECFTVIRPALRKYDIQGAFFVTTDLIDNRIMFFENAISLCIGAVEELSDEQAAEFVRVLAVDQILNDPKRLEAFNISQSLIRRIRIESSVMGNHRLLILSLLMLQQQDARLIDTFCGCLGIDQVSYLQQRPLYMTSAQIRQACGEGFTMGAHGTAHIKLRLMASPQLIESEIVTSCDIIRQISGQKKVPFAFPYTGNGLEAAFLSDLLRRYDFIELFFDLQGLRKSPPFIVNRLWADIPADRTNINLDYQLSRAWSDADVWVRRS